MTSDTEIELHARLASIADLDLNAGLRMAGGKPAFYRRLLGLFIEHHGDNARQLSELIEHNDLAGAQRLAHTLKGTTGNVGAIAIHELAKDLDAALKRGDRAAAQAALSPVAERLPRLIGALREALEQSADTAKTPTDTAPIGRDLLGRLAALLANDDFTVINLLTAKQAALRAAMGAEFDSVRQRIDAFDFPAALATVQKMIRRGQQD